MLKKFLKLLNKKGQSILYFAGLAPLVFAFGCAGIDIGWYFLNVSRLQNAADAAAVAGAIELTKKDRPLYLYEFDQLLEETKTYEEDTLTDIESYEHIAKQYANSNLGNFSNIGEDTVKDSWSQNEVSFIAKLYGPNNPPEKFYCVKLKEEVKHAFGFLTNSVFKKYGIDIPDTIPITVSAAAKVKRFPNYSNDTNDAERPSLAEQMEALRDGEDAVEGRRARKSVVYTYFEVMQQEYREESAANKAAMQKEIEQAVASGVDEETAKKEALERWINKLAAEYIRKGIDANTARKRANDDLTTDRSLTKARERSIKSSGNWWLKDLTKFRTENLTLRGIGGPTWKDKQFDFDDLFVDFSVDFSYNKPEQDWDIGYPKPNRFQSNTQYRKYFHNQSDPGNISEEYRIYGIIGIEKEESTRKFPYQVREGREAPDPLFIRIESETMKPKPYYTGNAWNTVHQIIINVNCSNYDPNTDETDQSGRAIVFYYDGPEKIDENSHVRDSKPIILNLNANFRGIIYAPNTPVIICGNNHHFRGFIVAKEFLELKTDKDFENEDFVKAFRQDVASYKSNVKNNNKIYIKPENIKTLEEGEEIPENCIPVKYNNETNHYIDREAEFYEELTTFEVNSSYIQKFAPIFINNKADKEKNLPSGDVQTKNSINATHTGESKARKNEEADNRFDKSDFNLKSSVYDPFKLLDFANYTYLNDSGDLDNMFVYTRAQQIR